MNTKSVFSEQMARVSERNSGAPAKGRKNIGRGKRATRALPLLKTKKKWSLGNLWRQTATAQGVSPETGKGR